MVTGLVLVKYQSFNGGIVLTNLAYEIALTIREAQTYGINVKGQLTNFNLSYGVHFDTTTNTSFTMFADKQDISNPDPYGISKGDGKYDGGSGGNDINVDTFMLKRGIVINKFCVGVSPSEVCSSSGSKLDITFNRPDPSAIIWHYDDSIGWQSYTSARIQVMATGNNAKKDIIIQSTGQILIKDGQ